MPHVSQEQLDEMSARLLAHEASEKRLRYLAFIAIEEGRGLCDALHGEGLTGPALERAYRRLEEMEKFLKTGVGNVPGI